MLSDSFQEMANPSVQKHLHFYSKDGGPNLSETWQGRKWLHETDSSLLTPSVKKEKSSTFWSLRCSKTELSMCMDSEDSGWHVQTFTDMEVEESHFLLSFPSLALQAAQLGFVHPSQITGEEIEPGDIISWMKIDPREGNPWHTKAKGKRVLAFPIWLYCDDTSGNQSKKWNKHNSFLFTAAAPTLEMLEGIVEQLETAQESGVWAWDCQAREMVLLVPSVHALLGDNPMQSEFACHIGFRGKFFCRVCKVKGKAESEQCDDPEDNGDAQSDITVQSHRAQGKKKSQESGEDMILRIRQFMSCGEPRTRVDTLAELRSQFSAGSRIGGATSYKARKTASGVKDVYQEYFINQIQGIAKTKGLSKPQKKSKIQDLCKTFPRSTISPVWKIKGIDPHADTPVEILHVILLGFVKYFWRDAVNRTKNEHDTLIARLSSAQVSGLNIPPLSGRTLVDYSGSLTGRDFRAIAQVAPFVLDGLIPADCLEAWTALSSLVCLVWQLEIHNVEKYLNDLELAITYFLDCTCRVTPRWFNKPKFHVLLHLPEHIRRFGPAMLFATKGFESFNAVIRSCSIHSNRHAPSKDIAFRMA
ncbi:hypothetical protein K435DRAFT_791971 [Dendrothele bispora CBS 962.96]|uniref:Uncharacterized protein n=1 Tax=Dendrothele bispora (strain CBS 962.96) TaxID=1314807 RepID=A0A4V4HHM1_DENBC|nr:hypothetical protein K435DRAFT_791971 [Dendrothele bispora CBS 962.96]